MSKYEHFLFLMVFTIIMNVIAIDKAIIDEVMSI